MVLAPGDLNKFEKLATSLGSLKDKLGVVAIMGVDEIGAYQRNMRSFIAMYTLIGAAKEVAKAIGQHEAFRVVCAEFAHGTIAGESLPSVLPPDLN